MELPFIISDTTADVKVRAQGKDLPELFRNVALGMREILKPVLESRQPIAREIAIESSDKNALLIDFLNELLYQMDANQEVYYQLNIKIEDEKKLKAKLLANPLIKFQTEIKAATSHNLEIKKTDDHFEAEVVFDI